MSNTKTKSKNAALLGMFTALVIVLQLMSYFIKIGTFNLSLVLIPIVLAAVLYGPRYGAVLGGVFGVVVTLTSAAGLDAGGHILFESSWFLTTFICILKGVAAGALAGMAANIFKGKNIYLSVILAAVTAPVVNTGIFVLGMIFFFKDTLYAWANGTNIAYYIVFGLVGVNFLIEFALNVILSPAVLSAAKEIKKLH